VVVSSHSDWERLLAEVQRKLAVLQHKVDEGHHMQRVADDYGMLTRKPFQGYRHALLNPPFPRVAPCWGEGCVLLSMRQTEILWGGYLKLPF